MLARSLVELMRDSLLEHLFMKVAVYLIEEVIYTAVKDYVQARLDKMSHIDDSVVLPVLRILLYASEALSYMPLLRERIVSL